jgi:hypothetical protein
MNRLILIYLLLPAVLLSACATPSALAPIPLRDADLYPESQTKAGIAVAVDELTYPERAKQYFGIDLIKEEVLPINIIVSNHGQGRYVIKPSDVLLMHGKEVVDPMPVKSVEAAICNEYGRISHEKARTVDAYFGKVMLQEAVVVPNGNYQGVIFLKAERRKGDGSGTDEQSSNMIQLLREGRLKIRVAVTDLETSERIHFGPFSLTGL